MYVNRICFVLVIEERSLKRVWILLIVSEVIIFHDKSQGFISKLHSATSVAIPMSLRWR